MKKILLFSIFAIIVILVIQSCRKKKEDPAPAEDLVKSTKDWAIDPGLTENETWAVSPDSSENVLVLTKENPSNTNNETVVENNGTLAIGSMPYTPGPTPLPSYKPGKPPIEATEPIDKFLGNFWVDDPSGVHTFEIVKVDGYNAVVRGLWYKGIDVPIRMQYGKEWVDLLKGTKEVQYNGSSLNLFNMIKIQSIVQLEVTYVKNGELVTHIAYPKIAPDRY